MAVTVNIYPNFLELLATAAINLQSDTLKVALLTTAATFSSADTGVEDVSANEVAAAGYSAGGTSLTGTSISTSNSLLTLSADNAVWEDSTIDAGAAVLYDSTADDQLIAFIDFGEELSSTDDSFTVDWNVDGVLTIGVS